MKNPGNRVLVRRINDRGQGAMAQHITASDPSMPAVCYIHTGATPSSVGVFARFWMAAFTP